MTQPTAIKNAVWLPHSAIEPNPFQPRRHFGQAELDDLRASIREHGIVQPLVVRPVEEKSYKGVHYWLIAGERRWRAADGELELVPCLVREVDDIKAGLLALVENIQRVDLNPLDEAEHISKMVDEAAARSVKLSVKDIAKSLGKGRGSGWVQNRLDLLKFRPDVQAMVSRFPDTMSHARHITKVTDEFFRAELIEVASQGESVVDIQKRIEGENARRAWQRDSQTAPDAFTRGKQSHGSANEAMSETEAALQIAERALRTTRAHWQSTLTRRQKNRLIETIERIEKVVNDLKA